VVLGFERKAHPEGWATADVQKIDSPDGAAAAGGVPKLTAATQLWNDAY
jgi:hypothetical protein